MSGTKPQTKTKSTTRVETNTQPKRRLLATATDGQLVGNNSQKAPSIKTSVVKQKQNAKKNPTDSNVVRRKGTVPILRNNPLPSNTASFVHPRKTGVDLADVIQSRLKKKSPWYDSIMKPINGGSVKIPDPVGTNTGTYQHIQNVSVQVNAQGVSGLRVVSPYINSYDQGGNPNGSNIQRTGSTSTTANLAWGSGSTTGGMTSFTAIPALMKANALSHRVVSACVTAQAETATLNDAGEMVAFVTPFRCQPSSVSTTFYNAQWDASIIPINAHKPIIARHYPISSDWDPFDGNALVPAGEEVTASYQDFIDPKMGSAEEDDGVLPWEFGVVCSGMTPSSGLVRFQIVVNYEFVPLTSTAMVTQSPSPNDPFEENFVLTRVASEPMTGVVTQKQASSAPSDTSIPEEETGFGMFADIVKQIVPLALEGLKFV